jgi:hypothetical protein
MTTQDEHDAIADKIDEKVRNAIGKKCHLSYSAYEYDKNDNPIDNLDKIVAKGKCVFIRTLSDYPYISEVIENPTWMDVCKIANDSILYIDKNGRIDHVFLESATEVGALDYGRIKILEMFFGS